MGLSQLATNKASGGDEITVELIQILKDDAVKVLHSICQQIWETQQWPQDWKRSVFIPIPKKGNAKACSNYCTIAFISHVSKVMLKILQARLQQYMDYISIRVMGQMSGSPFTTWVTLLQGFPNSSAVKNPPTMQETQVQSLGQEELPRGRNGNPLQYSHMKNPMDRGACGGYSPQGSKELDTTEHLTLLMQDTESLCVSVSFSPVYADNFNSTYHTRLWG